MRHFDNTAVKVKRRTSGGPVSPESSIAGYAKSLPPNLKATCRALQVQIEESLPKATSKIWHAMPVWFVGETPVVGYKAAAKHVTLLFWNGQAFSDPTLVPAGKYKAAQIKYQAVADIDVKRLKHWLKKAGSLIWDVRTVRRATSARDA
jgi:hypothetical protein